MTHYSTTPFSHHDEATLAKAIKQTTLAEGHIARLPTTPTPGTNGNGGDRRGCNVKMLAQVMAVMTDEYQLATQIVRSSQLAKSTVWAVLHELADTGQIYVRPGAGNRPNGYRRAGNATNRP